MDQRRCPRIGDTQHAAGTAQAGIVHPAEAAVCSTAAADRPAASDSGTSACASGRPHRSNGAKSASTYDATGGFCCSAAKGRLAMGQWVSESSGEPYSDAELWQADAAGAAAAERPPAPSAGCSAPPEDHGSCANVSRQLADPCRLADAYGYHVHDADATAAAAAAAAAAATLRHAALLWRHVPSQWYAAAAADAANANANAAAAAAAAATGAAAARPGAVAGSATAAGAAHSDGPHSQQRGHAAAQQSGIHDRLSAQRRRRRRRRAAVELALRQA